MRLEGEDKTGFVLGKGPVQSRFERIQPGTLPPKIIDISSQAAPEDTFLIHAHLESQDLLLSLFASQQTGEGVRLTNLVAHVLKLKGTLRVKAFRDGKDVKIRTNFEGRPDIKISVRPTNPYQDPTTLVDMGVVEQNVRNAISLAATTFTITHLLMPGDLSTLAPEATGETTEPQRPDEIRVRASDAGWGIAQSDVALLNQRFAAQNLQNQMAQLASSIQQPAQRQSAHILQQVPPQSRPQPIHHVSVQKGPEAVQTFSVHPSRQQQQVQQASARVSSQPPLTQPQSQQSNSVQGVGGAESLFEPVSPTQYQSAFTSPSPGPPKPPRMVGDRRLLVKLIKGSSLASHEGASVSPVCYVSTDEPVQSYTSSVVKTANNPFWDEHFLFDVTNATREVKFEVYDKSRRDASEVLCYIEDLKRTPSSRQILRLQAEPGTFDYTTGTITAEFLFMEPAEADLLLNSMNTSNSQLSPRRRIEVSQTVTPSGTRVTTTTTTTQKPQYGRQEPGYNTTPNYVEKYLNAEADTSVASDSNSPSTGADSSAGEHDCVFETYLGFEFLLLVLLSKKRGLFPEKKKTSFWKRFGRKKRSYSADRSSSSVREGSYLRPPEPQYGAQSKDDLELVRPQEPGSPNLKKSRSLGGSLKKLFKRGRKSRSRAREADTSRESSLSRGSGRNPASRDGSLSRQAAQNRASSVS
ncbi:hypothetical protein C0Q70_12267 [Pomacea canaliculata]|uniref:C2 domain-containing protein n=1 Tax=Pomacea canaliculata TaxID=400727 RepID=A0A2T7P134_POMCA|nr:hypothetical protein C0Q70_12267 [Pomacea canaliculata]